MVRLAIQLWPSGIIFNTGEKLMLNISGEKLGVAPLPFLHKGRNVNKGNYIIHIGKDYQSQLRVSTKARASPTATIVV